MLQHSLTFCCKRSDSKILPSSLRPPSTLNYNTRISPDLIYFTARWGYFLCIYIFCWALIRLRASKQCGECVCTRSWLCKINWYVEDVLWNSLVIEPINTNISNMYINLCQINSYGIEWILALIKCVALFLLSFSAHSRCPDITWPLKKDLNSFKHIIHVDLKKFYMF